jgi:hypothetical protein
MYHRQSHTGECVCRDISVMNQHGIKRFLADTPYTFRLCYKVHVPTRYGKPELHLYYLVGNNPKYRERLDEKLFDILFKRLTITINNVLYIEREG